MLSQYFEIFVEVRQISEPSAVTDEKISYFSPLTVPERLCILVY